MSRLPAFLSYKLGAATALALGLLALHSAAPAQTAPAGAAARPESSPRPGREGRAPAMTLQASASTEVMQDTVHISLSTVVEAPDQPTAGKLLTAALDEVVKRAKEAKDASGVEVRTGGFNVWPNANDQGKISGWRGQGEIVLQSKDFAKASALASSLGDKAAISSIVFLLSREAREEQEGKLLAQAAQAFRERAKAAVQAFGFSGYRIVRIDLGGAGNAPQAPMPRGVLMAKAASADVPLEAGAETVTVSVSGTIALQ